MDLKHVRPVILAAGLVVLAIALGIMVRQTFSKNVPAVETPIEIPKATPFKLSSSVFEDAKPIPTSFTCGTDIQSPPLTISSAPSNTKEFALVMREVVTGADSKTHWAVWHIPGDTKTLASNDLQNKAVQGTNDNKATAYLPPCPEKGSGIHTYIFELYALSDTISLESGKSKDELIAAINGKVISKAQLTGTVEITQ